MNGGQSIEMSLVIASTAVDGDDSKVLSRNQYSKWLTIKICKMSPGKMIFYHQGALQGPDLGQQPSEQH